MLTRTAIRQACDADAPAIRALLNANDCYTEDLDWSHIEPYWLVAEHEGRIVGVVNVLPGLPLGFMDQLVVLPNYIGSGVGLSLGFAAEKILRLHGCSGYVSHTVHVDILDKREALGLVTLVDAKATVVFKKL